MIKINGKSATDMHITFSQLPSIPAPERDYEEKIVSGRSGSLIIDKGTYKDIPISLTGHAENTRSNLIDYFGFTGELSFDNSPDVFWKYRVKTGNFNQILDDGELIAFDIYLMLNPYQYLISGRELITGTQSVTLYNKYNAEAYPHIKVYGKGEVVISLDGSQKLKIVEVSDYVEIDTENDVVYRGSLGMDDKTSGEMFCIEKGKNSVLTFTGASKVEIRPNWRQI
ncbi:hypothetical protein ACGCUP_00850 [Eubacteriales bacterium KG125]